MKELSKKETMALYGGGGITAAIINALTKGFSLFVDVGRFLGSSIRRIFDNKLCNY